MNVKGSGADTLLMLSKNMTERDLMDTVLEYLRALGFLCYHTRDSRRSESGFPDVCAAGHGRVLFIELKREGQRLRKGTMGRYRLHPGQEQWQGVLMACLGVEYFLIQPSDWLSGDFQRYISGEDR